jgi:hypothetical protein
VSVERIQPGKAAAPTHHETFLVVLKTIANLWYLDKNLAVLEQALKSNEERKTFDSGVGRS